ncbi:glucose transporter, putative [Bodo saltans]|uniref:Glucose transporter, putative n=1 Tax=Bodo saltans TaxID=75058 RepID=A0A0S4JEY7_BODSA|nr:glucose transporter, putative [Bodo saltans]|eukprot:CUG89022.1 glucose transporter, putative [Bodo saltans]
MSCNYIKGFFTLAVLKVAFINLVGGGIYGLGIGFVPIHTTFVEISQNCTLYESSEACDTVSGTTCRWGYTNVTSKAECLFTDVGDCRVFNGTTSDQCSMLPYCVWSYDDKLCQHAAGYSAIESGIFSGAMIVGGLIGSLIIPNIVNRFGRKKCMIGIGVVSILSSILVHIASKTYLYGLLIAARILFGIAMGALCCVGPMYVDEMVSDDYHKPVGVLFQVFCTFGIMLAALVGLLLNPTDFTADVNMPARFQGFDAIVTLYSVLVLFAGITMEESTKWLRDGGAAAQQSTEVVVSKDPTTPTKPTLSWSGMKLPLFVAFCLCVAQQMTGINAIMNYAPNITKSMNLKPLTGNFIVMVWNFVTTLASIPIASRVSMRRMFLTGTLIASLACLCTGIPVYPGVTTNTIRSALSGVGIAVFIAAFEIGMGPCFYVLSQILFPEWFRNRGSSFTMVTQFLFNIMINVVFPIAVVAISGGISGDQNKGMGITFIFFGVCGLLSFVVLLKFMEPYEGTSGRP